MIPVTLRNRPFLPIATERLILRPLEKGDVATMARLINDRRIAEMTARIPHPYTLQDGEKFLVYAQESLKNGTDLTLSIIRKSDQAFMGSVGLEEEIGYWLGAEFWGQGYMKEAVKALIHFAFFTLHQEAIKGSALEHNAASRRILEELGFIQTGTKEISSLGYEGKKKGITYILPRETFIERYYAKERPLVWVVAAALINKRGKLLLAERLAGKHMAGVWELPGGKMETGETPEQSLIRELKEELDISVREDDLEPLSFASHRYETFHLIMPVYLCRRWEGTPRGAEGQKLAWVSYTDMVNYPVPPADIPLIHRLADALKIQEGWGNL